MSNSLRAWTGMAAAVLAVGLGACGEGSRPSGDFARAPAPKRPDYTLAASWAVLPQNTTAGGWEKPWGVDVFFVHPASAFDGKDWNVAIDQADAARRLDQVVIPNHAGPFMQAGPVYAPRYRQADYWVEANVGGGGDGALLVAYNDVLAAFDEYVKTYNRDRGIILAGVGQGGLYVQRLLADRFADGKLKDRLGAAYIIDAALPADAPGKLFAQPVCDGPEAIHCVLAWKTVVKGDDQKAFRDGAATWAAGWKVAPAKGLPLVCINPVTWTASEEMSPKTDHRGGARAKGAGDINPEVIAQQVSAQCKAGVLEVERPAAAQLKASGEWSGRFKSPDYNLFYADIVAGVADRATTLSVWLDANAPKPAEPLPPANDFDDRPIHREGGEPIPVPQSGN